MKTARIHSSALFLLLCIQSVGLWAQETAPLTVYYYERNPFEYQAPNGKPAGFIVDISKQAFQAAGIAVNWTLLPLNRVLKTIEEDAAPACTPGWYRKPEREAFGKYSHPIYLDKPIVGFSHASLKVPANVSARELLGRPDIHLLVNHSLVYGEYLDQLVRDLPASRVEWSSGTFLQFARKLRGARANLLLLTQEEIDAILNEAELSRNDYKTIYFSDVSYREYRYIICSQSVPDSVLKKLNSAIDQLVLPK